MIPTFLAVLALHCADNPASSSPAPFTDTITGTVAAAGTSRQALSIPRSGDLLLTLKWTGAVDLNLYLAPSSCSALNPKSQCNVLLESHVGTSQEAIARAVRQGESFSVFVENMSASQTSSYTLDIRIEDPRLDSAFK